MKASLSYLCLVCAASLFFHGQTSLAYSRGTQFAVSVPQRYVHHQNNDLYLYVASTHVSSEIFIYGPHSGTNINRTVYRGVTKIDLSNNLAEHNEDRPANGFSVTSQLPVSVYLIDYVDYVSDGTELLPITQQNEEFFVVTATPTIGKSQFTVTAIGDYTHVKISVKAASGSLTFESRSYSDDDVIYVSLSRLESIQIQHDADLTGTHITSDKPVSIITGNDCVEIPRGVHACDRVLQQLPPVSEWGPTHIISHLRTRHFNTFRILSAYDQTRVQVGALGNYTLNKGNFVERRVSNDVPILIEADKPILVIQFSEGTMTDNVTGDPFMAVVPSVQHFSDNYVFMTPEHFTMNHLTITIETTHASGSMLNGQRVSRADEHTVDLFQRGTHMRFSVIRLDIASGFYNLTHTDTGVRFGALLYGFDTYAGYGFALGYDMDVIIGISLEYGNTSRSGILQVDVGGVWTHVCADGVGVEEARVICRTMGYDKYPLTSSAVQRIPPLHSTHRYLPRLHCRGYEVNVKYCVISGGYALRCPTTDQLLIDCAPPLTEIVQSRCTTSHWAIDIDMDKLGYRYPGSVATDVYLGDNSCLGTLSGHQLSFHYDIHSCLTTEAETNDNLVYSNELVYAYHDPMNPFIIRKYNWTLDVTCLIPRNQSSHSQVSYNQSTAVDAKLNTTTQVKPIVQMYTDPNFMNPIHGAPIQVALGTNVYVKTYVNDVDWSLRMKLTSCYTSPSQTGGDMRYYLVRNGCEMDANTHVLSEAAHETRFVFSMFEMTSNHQNLFLHCDATICDTSDVTSRAQCNQQCNTGR